MPGSAETERFYADLPSLDDFERFAEFDAYRPVPEDWVVLAGDVEASTAAIAAGHYKAVNMVGAAAIAAVLNVCRDIELPFVFGGDGGAVLVPSGRAKAAAAALRQLQAHARRVYGLGLRAAAVPVARLRAEGHDVRVRRLALNGTNHLALFAGSGLARVDDTLKDAQDDPAILAPQPEGLAPDLDGLSCRWEPLAAAHGNMIALMVQPVGDAADGYRVILARIAEILRSLPAHSPASDCTLRFRWPPRGLVLEARAAARGGLMANALARVALTSLVQRWCHWCDTRAGHYDAPRYLNEMKAQTDFRKFDGCLRTVLDCSDAQVAASRNGWSQKAAPVGSYMASTGTGQH